MRAAPLLLAVVLASPAAGQVVAPAPPRIPSVPRLIGGSVLEALRAEQELELAGVFAFIPPNQTAMAMADFLMHERRALKRLVKRDERDLKKLGGIDAWDKEVYLFIVGVHAQPVFPAGVERLKKRMLGRIQKLSLAPGLSLGRISQLRAARG